MSQIGEVNYASAHKMKNNEGSVEFLSEKDMKTAIEKLDGTMLGGNQIKLIERSKAGRINTEAENSKAKGWVINESNFVWNSNMGCQCEVWA